MTTPLRYLLLAACCVTALAAPGLASANHNSDQHRAMRIDWSGPEGPTRTHSDIAMWGDIVVAGNYDGFRIFDISRPVGERLVVNYLCRGPQNDVSLWRHNGRLLLFQSVDTPQTNGTTVCSTVRTSDTSACGPACFEGIRIFDITNPAQPQYIRAVYTDCGSHTHTLVPDLANNRVLLYISSVPGSTGPNCQAPHAKISIVSVPLDAPETAAVIAQPPITGQNYGSVRGCHDITVYMAIHKAAASCQSEGQIWDISNPAAPDTINAIHVDTTGVNYWHSAAFTWDGEYVVWDDESFTGSCNAGNDGRIRIWRMSDQTFVSNFMIPRPQGTYCSVHNGNIIPVGDRYLFVAAWYAGGTSIVDFTNPAQPREVAFYDAIVGRGAADTWSSYWYNGRIYANDITRGVDVFQAIVPSMGYGLTWDHLNAQTQEDDLFGTPPIGSTRPLARLLSPSPGGTKPARVNRARSTARARGWLSRSRVR